MAKHRIAVTETLTVYYEFEGTLKQAERLCKQVNEGKVEIDDKAEFVGDSDWTEHSDARVV